MAPGIAYGSQFSWIGIPEIKSHYDSDEDKLAGLSVSLIAHGNSQETHHHVKYAFNMSGHIPNLGFRKVNRIPVLHSMTSSTSIECTKPTNGSCMAIPVYWNHCNPDTSKISKVHPADGTLAVRSHRHHEYSNFSRGLSLRCRMLCLRAGARRKQLILAYNSYISRIMVIDSIEDGNCQNTRQGTIQIMQMFLIALPSRKVTGHWKNGHWNEIYLDILLTKDEYSNVPLYSMVKIKYLRSVTKGFGGFMQINVLFNTTNWRRLLCISRMYDE